MKVTVSAEETLELQEVGQGAGGAGDSDNHQSRPWQTKVWPFKPLVYTAIAAVVVHAVLLAPGHTHLFA